MRLGALVAIAAAAAVAVSASEAGHAPGAGAEALAEPKMNAAELSTEAQAAGAAPQAAEQPLDEQAKAALEGPEEPALATEGVPIDAAPLTEQSPADQSDAPVADAAAAPAEDIAKSMKEDDAPEEATEKTSDAITNEQATLQGEQSAIASEANESAGAAAEQEVQPASFLSAKSVQHADTPKAADDLDALLYRLENDDSYEALARELAKFEVPEEPAIEQQQPMLKSIASNDAPMLKSIASNDEPMLKSIESNDAPTLNKGEIDGEKAMDANDDDFPMFDDLVFEDDDTQLEEEASYFDALEADEFEERAAPTPGFEIDGSGGDGLNNWGGVYNTTVVLEAGEGWVEFLFNQTGTNVTSTFLAYSADQALALYLTDIGCSGDMFAVYDNGVFIGASSTPTVNNCANVVSDPSVAYTTPGYSTFTATLAAGVHHVITLEMVASPYGGGTGAIQVNYNLSTCTVADTGIHVITDPLPHNETDAACDGLGMRPLDVTIYNFANATTVLFECLGAYANAYIGSYWGNTYMDSPLALWVSWVLPGGAVAPTLSGDIPLPIMCQNRTYFTTFSDSE